MQYQHRVYVGITFILNYFKKQKTRWSIFSWR